MSEFDVERWLASRKEAGLKIDPRLLRLTGNMGRSWIPMGSIQICRRNVSKLEGNISLDPAEVTYGSTSGISRTKPVKPYGKNINPNWHSLLD